MEWLYLDGVENLKKYAVGKYAKNTFRNFKNEIKEDLIGYVDTYGKGIKGREEIFKVTANSWGNLYLKINLFRTVVNNLGDKKEVESSKSEEIYESEYFKSKSDELIFYILELSGKKRNEMLGVKDEFYKERALAEKWRKSILLKIHPDVSKNIRASEAVIEFNKLCEMIVG